MTDKPREVWLSGTEHINLVSDLLDSEKKSDFDNAIGRTNKLALQYALLCLQTPFHKVIIKDHYNSKQAHRSLQLLVCQLLDKLHIEYSIGVVPHYIKDENEFTGVRAIEGMDHYIIATPHLI